MSQYRSPLGPPPNPAVQMMKDRAMGESHQEQSSELNRSREDKTLKTLAYDELGRPLNRFTRFLRWMRKMLKGY